MAKNALVLFHSICGNTYLLARMLVEALKEEGIEADLRRVPERGGVESAAESPAAREFAGEIALVPELKSMEAVRDCDFLFMGSPTCFGNVSGSMKCTMDAFACFWADSGLYGKPFGAFTCAGTATGGGGLCLQTLNTFALHLGMLPVPAAVAAKGTVQPAYGLLHCSGGDSGKRPDAEAALAVREYVSRMLSRFGT